MKDQRSGNTQNQGHGSWACEALPMSVRKELLKRELHKLGLRRAGGGSSSGAGEASPRDDSDGSANHPQGAGDDEGHGG